MFKIFVFILSISSYLLSSSIEGTVSYGGSNKKPKNLSMDSDPICGTSHSIPPKNENFILNEDNNFKNVIVWLKNIAFEDDLISEPLTIDQLGCMYSPHVNALTVGQSILIKNSDQTLHNVNSQSKVNDSFNSAQPAGVPDIKKIFTEPEAPFYIKCDVHPWMKAWIMVADHPYFAITDENGYYKIDNIPEGNYEVVFWQEKLSNLPAKKFNLPSNTLEVTVSDSDRYLVDFKFQSPAEYKK